MTLLVHLHVPPDLVMLLVSAAVIMSAAIRTAIRKRLHGERSPARRWPTLMATIDVVSVSELLAESHGTSETTGFLATLTYFYRNPELQMGEYERFFGLESVARAWVEQFKGRQAPVHVNPQRPEQSVLLDEDVQALTTQPVLSVEDAIDREETRALPGFLRTLAALCQAICMAGVAASVVAFLRSMVGGSVPPWLRWTGGAALAFAAACSFVVTLQVADGPNRAVLRGYSLLCPAWVRWSLKVLGVVVFLFTASVRLQGILPLPLQENLRSVVPHLLYLIACWAFLSMAAFFWATLRMQTRTDPRVQRAGDVTAG